MLDASAFRELVSGRRRGAGAALARGVLRAAEVPYSLGVRWRNRRYDRNDSAATRVSVPVVCVGNLTLGGTGKTPMVKWIARWFGERGVRVAIVSRGYGAAAGAKNDEALELEQALPGVPHVQNPDRVAGAREAIERFGAGLILLDDGFQHRRLARDLNVVLLDATAPFGYEHVFPRGMLREPVEGLARAGVVCLTRADALDARGRAMVRQRVAELAPQAAWCEASHTPCELRNVAGETRELDSVKGARVAAFSGIGNPAAFRRTLEGLGADIGFWREFPDHNSYGDADRAALAAAIADAKCELVVATHKDLVKLPIAELGGCPLWALVVEMRFADDGAVLASVLEKVLPASRP
jgi:tetraacyldisaccharide 4'-kinase